MRQSDKSSGKYLKIQPPSRLKFIYKQMSPFGLHLSALHFTIFRLTINFANFSLFLWPSGLFARLRISGRGNIGVTAQPSLPLISRAFIYNACGAYVQRMQGGAGRPSAGRRTAPAATIVIHSMLYWAVLIF